MINGGLSSPRKLPVQRWQVLYEVNLRLQDCILEGVTNTRPAA